MVKSRVLQKVWNTVYPDAYIGVNNANISDAPSHRVFFSVLLDHPSPHSIDIFSLLIGVHSRCQLRACVRIAPHMSDKLLEYGSNWRSNRPF